MSRVLRCPLPQGRGRRYCYRDRCFESSRSGTARLTARAIRVDDLGEQRDEAVAPLVANACDHARLMGLGGGLELAHQRGAVRGQIERVGALVARLPPLGERALLQLVEHADEVGALDAERFGDLALRQSRVALDDGQHRELRGPDVERREGREEILEYRELRAAQHIADQLRQRSEIDRFAALAHPLSGLSDGAQAHKRDSLERIRGALRRSPVVSPNARGYCPANGENAEQGGIMRGKLIALSAAFCLAAGAAAAQDKTFELKLAHWVPPSHPLQKALEEGGASVRSEEHT